MSPHIRYILLLVVLCAASSGLFAGLQAHAAEPTSVADSQDARRGPPLGLGWRIRTAAVHQFDTPIQGGGELDATRAVLDVSARYGFEKGSGGVSLGYTFDGYGFSDDVRIDGLAPWSEIHTLRFAAPIIWEPSPDWLIVAIPRMRMAAESTSDWGDGLTGGAILGFSYRINDRLRVGPGFGIASGLEESTNYFPVLVIDWRVTDRLRLETGRGLGATRGPGLVATYQFSPFWRVSLGFRREKLRFRLSDAGSVPRGIGEDRSFPVLAGITFGPPFLRAALVAGAEFGGELRLEDENGNRLAKTSYDSAPFVGFTLRGSF